ncbi:MAG: hypothetical protein JNM76_09705 [Betaproteobacteria bacterium]|nr:hypothetical protein [Betaproteobacteria bacterium]
MYVVSATPERTRPGPARRIVLAAIAIAIVIAVTGFAVVSLPAFADPPVTAHSHGAAQR